MEQESVCSFRDWTKSAAHKISCVSVYVMYLDLTPGSVPQGSTPSGFGASYGVSGIKLSAALSLWPLQHEIFCSSWSQAGDGFFPRSGVGPIPSLCSGLTSRVVCGEWRYVMPRIKIRLAACKRSTLTSLLSLQDTKQLYFGACILFSTTFSIKEYQFLHLFRIV